MATAKITLSASRDIPFNKLVLSQSNVRRVKAGVSIEELAEDIARRSLLQGLIVRSVLGADGQETGMFEVPAGGRRFRALELLVKQKRMNKTQPVPCVVRTDGLAEEDSLAENVQREALHPLDQFRAFQTLRQKGLSEEDIAARFFANPTIVKQRLKLAAASEKLLDVYAEDGMTLEQLMAFTVTNDHACQERVWEQLARSHNTEPYYIRRLLTEGAVRAADKRAQFVGVDAYEAAVRLQQHGRVVFLAAVDGRVYARHGTCVETRLTVIDKVPANDPTAFPSSPGLAPHAAVLLDWVTRLVPERAAAAAVPTAGHTVAPIVRRAPLRRRRGAPSHALPPSPPPSRPASKSLTKRLIGRRQTAVTSTTPMRALSRSSTTT
jgi:ParB/RepB/Spo0J family partition protein